MKLFFLSQGESCKKKGKRRRLVERYGGWCTSIVVFLAFLKLTAFGFTTGPSMTGAENSADGVPLFPTEMQAAKIVVVFLTLTGLV